MLMSLILRRRESAVSKDEAGTLDVVASHKSASPSVASLAF